MADNFKHYGVEVIHQYITDDSFLHLLERNNVKYQELPTDKWIVMYTKDDVKRYALIEQRSAPDAYVEEVYITSSIPDDCDWDNLVRDINEQKQGKAPMEMETRFHKYLKRALRNATEELGEKYCNDTSVFDPSVPSIPDDELYQCAARYMSFYGYDKERIKNADTHDVAQNSVEVVLKYIK